MKFKDGTLFVCHDAGTAQIITAWLQEEHLKNNFFYFKGPAYKIIKKKFNNIKFKEPNENLIQNYIKKSHTVICGTGWQTSIEYDAISLAKFEGKKTIAVLDHWVNYKSRFIRKNKFILPDEIWVTDKFALKYAKKIFTKVKITLKKNYYLEKEVNLILSKKNEQIKLKNQQLLYLCEPMRNTWGKTTQGEFQALKYFFKNIKKIGIKKETNICLRLHPSENKDKYIEFKDLYPNIIFSNGEIDLTHEIINSEYIVGCQSYAMVLALKSEKKVYCSLPPWAPKCQLPYSGLIMINNLI